MAQEMNGERRLRVVVFTGGAVLQEDCLQFIAALDAHPELEMVGVFCEASSTGLNGLVRDLWRRRRWLAPVLLLQRAMRRTGQSLASPRGEMRRRRLLRTLETRLIFTADLHAEPVLSRVMQLRPDVGAVYGGPVLRPELFDIPARGTLGIHHGKLPHYRGKKTTFWAMYNGEDTVGVAIQRIGTGLDRGEILRDAVLPTGGMPLPIVRRRLERRGLELYLEAVLAMRATNPGFKPQPPGGGPLFRDPRAVDIARLWCRWFSSLLRRSVARPGG